MDSRDIPAPIDLHPLCFIHAVFENPSPILRKIHLTTNPALVAEQCRASFLKKVIEEI
jgi:hypothetical protein